MKNILLLICLPFIFSCKKEEVIKDLDWKILNDKNKIPEQIDDYFKAAENGP